MSVLIKCDRCGKEIPYADDATVVATGNEAWWDAVEVHPSRKNAVTFPADSCKHLCFSCTDAHAVFMAGDAS